MARVTLHRYWLSIAAAASGFAAPVESHYIGSKACYGCHAAIYRSYSKTDMGRSMRFAADVSVDSVPDEATIQVPKSNRVLRVYHDRAGWHQSESEANVFVDDHPLDYVVGSGANGLTFLIQRDSYLFQAPLSYYSKVKKWDLSPGYEYGDYGFSRSTPEGCILCHSGRAQPAVDHPGAYRDPPFQELAIGCENCHGPGEEHARDPNRAGSIVNPQKLSPRLAENICMYCHQGGDARVLQPGKSYQDFRPGQWLFQTVAILKVPSQSEQQREQDLLEHNAAMQVSRCFRESGKLSCLTCHDPHVQPSPNEAPSYFRKKCLSCHTERSCSAPTASRLKQTPADDCIGCHMPKRSIAVISHSALTNHRIPARAGEPIPPWKPGSNDDLLVVNLPPGDSQPISDETLFRAYGELISKSPEYRQRYVTLLDQLSRSESKDPYVQAALGHKALAEGRNEDALIHLAAGIRLGEAAVYEDMGKAFANLGRSDEAVNTFSHGVEINPYQPELRKYLIFEYITLKRYAEARSAMREYVRTFPADDFMRNLLARAP